VAETCRRFSTYTISSHNLQVLVGFIPILRAGDVTPHFVAGGLYVRRCCKELKQEDKTKARRGEGGGGIHFSALVSVLHGGQSLAS
jgi:hypothetical protein